MQRVRGSRITHFYGCGQALLRGNDYRPMLEEPGPGQQAECWDFLVPVKILQRTFVD